MSGGRIIQPPVLFGYPTDCVYPPVESDLIVEIASLDPEIYKAINGTILKKCSLAHVRWQILHNRHL